MDESEDRRENSADRRSRGVRWGIFLGILGVLLAIVSGILADQQYRALVEEAQAIGLSVSVDELDQEVPDAENAAMVGIDFTKRPTAPPETLVDYRTGKVSADQAHRLIQSDLTISAGIETASWLPHFAPKRAHLTPLTYNYAPETWLKYWSQYYILRGRLAADEERWNDAEKDFLTATRLAQFASQGVGLFGLLVHISINSSIRSEVAWIVVDNEASPDSVSLYQTVRSRLDTVDFLSAWKQESALLVSHAWHLSEFEDYYEATSPSYSRYHHLPASPKKLATHLLRYQIDVLKSLDNYQIDPLAALDAMSRVTTEPAPPWTGEAFYLSILLPVYEPAYQSAIRDEVYSRIADLGVAAIKFKGEEGRYPAGLAEMETNVDLRDSFGSGELRYEVRDNGFIIWSVGEDGTDDGGDLWGLGSGRDFGFDTTFVNTQLMHGR